MSFLNSIAAKIRRGETPFWRTVKAVIKSVHQPPGLRFPSFLQPAGRALYQFHFLVVVIFRALRLSLYTSPLFVARCTKVGRRLRLDGKMPYVEGPVEIHLGDDVSLGGNIIVSSAQVLEQPRLIIGDRSNIGWNAMFTVSCEIFIEEDVLISYDCRFSDNDGHPHDPEKRRQHAPLDAASLRPVRICRNAWIGNGAHIMKGVTIGAGAIVGANSVVTKSVPPYCIAAGNPAQIIRRDIHLPAPPVGSH